MRRTAVLPLVFALLCVGEYALASQGSLTYRARVVHHNRSGLSFVSGTIDIGRGSFAEKVERSYRLDWKQFPGRLVPTMPALPNVWQVEEMTAQRYGTSMPRYDSPLLRHFVVGKIIGNPRGVRPKETYLSGQLVIETADFSGRSFEVVASFRGMPLVIHGQREMVSGKMLVRQLNVLGPASELYRYYLDDIKYSYKSPAEAIELPGFDPKDYVSFPRGGEASVAIRPVKDWLVLQANLPGGRPLNLVFDSGAETMIIDDLVLKMDARLEPVGEVPVSGAFESKQMKLYEGFELEIGGVEFKNLTVVGTPLTAMAMGAGMRIHGIIGGEVLRLCQLDLDLAAGQLKLRPSETKVVPEGEELPLTFIQELPHIEAQVEDGGTALLLLDTGQRTSLSVNLDYLDSYEMGDDLIMNGFLSDITGGLRPRFMLEELGISLAGRTYLEKTVDAGMESTFSYDGVPVIGSIGFPLLARHFGGITFDYSSKILYLRDPGENLVFSGRPEEWEDPAERLSRGLQLSKGRGNTVRRKSALLPDRSRSRDVASEESGLSKSTSNLDDPLTLIHSSSSFRPGSAGVPPAKDKMAGGTPALPLILRDGYPSEDAAKRRFAVKLKNLAQALSREITQRSALLLSIPADDDQPIGTRGNEEAGENTQGKPKLLRSLGRGKSD